MAPQGRYASIPPELARELVPRDIAIKFYPDVWDKHGAAGISMWGIALAVLLFAHLAFKWLFPPVETRLKLLILSPFLFLFGMMIRGGGDPLASVLTLGTLGLVGYLLLRKTISEKAGRIALFAVLPGFTFMLSHLVDAASNGHTSEKTSVYAAHAGTISASPDAMPAPAGDSESRQDIGKMTRKTSPDGKAIWENIPKGYVVPYHLQPEKFEPALADQAHYVLAQQAYLAHDVDNTARHLRAMSGSWRPLAWHTRGRIGALAEWAKLHGADPGRIAPKLANGAPFIWPRYIAGALLNFAGFLLGTAAIICVLLSLRLSRREDFFRKGLA
jgi:hypothetical protein